MVAVTAPETDSLDEFFEAGYRSLSTGIAQLVHVA